MYFCLYLVGDSDGEAGVGAQHCVDGVDPLNISSRKLGATAARDVNAVAHHEWPRQELHP